MHHAPARALVCLLVATGTLVRAGVPTVLAPSDAFLHETVLSTNTGVARDSAACPSIGTRSSAVTLSFGPAGLDRAAGTLAASSIFVDGRPCSGGPFELLDERATRVAANVNGGSFDDPPFTRLLATAIRAGTDFPDADVLLAAAPRLGPGDVADGATCWPGTGRSVALLRFFLYIPRTGLLTIPQLVGTFADGPTQMTLEKDVPYVALELSEQNEATCMFGGTKEQRPTRTGGNNSGAVAGSGASSGAETSGAERESGGGGERTSPVGIALGVMGTILALLIITVGGYLWRRKAKPRDHGDGAMIAEGEAEHEPCE
jgi:hypothetical protein